MVLSSHVHGDALVAAARAGDRAAMNELARRHLPMVYSLVRQALRDDPDVDDVVQDIMVRAIRQLPDLRSPGSFRPWLTAIAVRQIGSHLSREDAAARRVATLDPAFDRPDPGAEVEGPALLRMELAVQRRQVGHATGWMNADDRTVFSLWWLETLGELTRPEIAAALGMSVAHTGVRLQRMREQLELSRKIVTALEAAPGCRVLDEVVVDWDGTATAYWRKRIGRHVLSCPVCGAPARDLLPAERLLVGLALLPVPAALAAVALTKAFLSGATASSVTTTASGVASWLTRGFRMAAAHPVAVAVSAGALAAGIAVPVTVLPSTAPPARAVAGTPQRLSGTGAPQPSQSAGLLKIGKVSLESAAEPGHFVTVAGDRGVLAAAGPASDAAVRRQATLQVVAGLADPACSSFRGPDGRYLRHSSFQLRLSPDEGTVLFRRDATFCGRSGFLPGTLSLESVNYPGFFLRNVGEQLWVDQFDGSAPFRADSSFLIRTPLA